VEEHDGMLFAAGYYSGLAAVLDGIGVSTDHGDDFQPFMAFKDVFDPIDCDPSSFTATTCKMPQIDWQRERAQFGNGSSSVFPDGGLAGPDSGVAASDAGATAGNRDAGDAAMPAGRGSAGSAGAVDSGAGGRPNASKPGSGCGCMLGSFGRSRPAIAVWLLVAMLVVVRRRARTQP
jgi:hypothetical protein